MNIKHERGKIRVRREIAALMDYLLEMPKEDSAGMEDAIEVAVQLLNEALRELTMPSWWSLW